MAISTTPAARTASGPGSGSLERSEGVRRTVGDYTVPNPAMVCREVDVHYGDKHAIRKVSLDIANNEVIAMIGPSGCGKSTFLRCLNRLNDTIPTARISGSITLDGQDIYDKRQDVVQLRARVAWCSRSQTRSRSRSTRTSPTGRASTASPRTAPSSTRSCRRALKRAGLWEEVKDRLDQPGTALSGGQQQRLCIARTIAVNPR